MKRHQTLLFVTLFIAGNALLASSAALFPSQVAAQPTPRAIPLPLQNVKRGVLVVTAPPVVTLDGQPDRLSPGSRIRDTQNLLVMSGAVVGRPLPVLYRRDNAGLIHEVWVLTLQENQQLVAAEGTNLWFDLLDLIFGRR